MVESLISIGVAILIVSVVYCWYRCCCFCAKKKWNFFL